MKLSKSIGSGGYWIMSLVAVFFSVWLQISATVAPIGVKFCMMVHIGPVRSSPLRGQYPGVRKSEIFGPKFWPN